MVASSFQECVHSFGFCVRPVCLQCSVSLRGASAPPTLPVLSGNELDCGTRESSPPGGEWQATCGQWQATAERNTKHQSPSSREAPNLKTPTPKNRCRGKRRAGRFLSLEIGASLELGVWNLELVAWALSFPKIEMRPPNNSNQKLI